MNSSVFQLPIQSKQLDAFDLSIFQDLCVTASTRSVSLFDLGQLSVSLSDIPFETMDRTSKLLFQGTGTRVAALRLGSIWILDPSSALRPFVGLVEGNGSTMTDMDWSPTNSSILSTTTENGSLKVWDIRSPSNPGHLLNFGNYDHTLTEKYLSTSWCPYNPNLLASSTIDRVNIWDVRVVGGGGKRGSGLFRAAPREFMKKYKINNKSSTNNGGNGHSNDNSIHGHDNVAFEFDTDTHESNNNHDNNDGNNNNSNNNNNNNNEQSSLPLKFVWCHPKQKNNNDINNNSNSNVPAFVTCYSNELQWWSFEPYSSTFVNDEGNQVMPRSSLYMHADVEHMLADKDGRLIVCQRGPGWTTSFDSQLNLSQHHHTLNNSQHSHTHGDNGRLGSGTGLKGSNTSLVELGVSYIDFSTHGVAYSQTSDHASTLKEYSQHSAGAPSSVRSPPQSLVSVICDAPIGVSGVDNGYSSTDNTHQIVDLCCTPDALISMQWGLPNRLIHGGKTRYDHELSSHNDINELVMAGRHGRVYAVSLPPASLPPMNDARWGTVSDASADTYHKYNHTQNKYPDIHISDTPTIKGDSSTGVVRLVQGVPMRSNRTPLRPSRPRYSVAGLARDISETYHSKSNNNSNATATTTATTVTAEVEDIVRGDVSVNIEDPIATDNATTMNVGNKFPVDLWQRLQTEVLLLEDYVQRGRMVGLSLAGMDQFARQVSLEVECSRVGTAPIVEGGGGNESELKGEKDTAQFVLIISFPIPGAMVDPAPVFTIRSSNELRSVAVAAEAAIVPVLSEIFASIPTNVNKGTNILLEVAQCFRIRMVQLWEEMQTSRDGYVEDKPSAILSSVRIPVVDPLAYLIPCPVSSGATFSPQGGLLCFGGAKLLQTNIDSINKGDQAMSQRMDHSDEKDSTSNNKNIDIHDTGERIKSNPIYNRPDVIKMAIEQTAGDTIGVAVEMPFDYRHHSEADTTGSNGGNTEDDKDCERNTSQTRDTETYAEGIDEDVVIDVDNASNDGTTNNTDNTHSTHATNTAILEPNLIGEAAQKAGKTGLGLMISNPNVRTIRRKETSSSTAYTYADLILTLNKYESMDIYSDPSNIDEYVDDDNEVEEQKEENVYDNKPKVSADDPLGGRFRPDATTYCLENVGYTEQNKWLAANYRLGPLPQIRHRRRRAKSYSTEGSRQSHLQWDGVDRAATSAFVCRENAVVAEKCKLGRAAQLWNLLAVSFDLLQISRTGKARGTAAPGWSGSVMGGPLLHRIFSTLWNRGDTQTLATAVCIIGDSMDAATLLQQEQEQSKYQSIKDASTKPIMGLDDLDRVLVSYADILSHWGMLSTATEVLKHVSTTAAIVRSRGSESAWVNLTYKCMKCNEEVAPGDDQKKPISSTVTATTSYSLLNDGSVLCGRCTSFPLTCAVCACSIRGIGTFCIVCGHGGHAKHLSAWFEQHSECPAGCGCRCSEVEAPSIDMESNSKRTLPEPAVLDVIFEDDSHDGKVVVDDDYTSDDSDGSSSYGSSSDESFGF